MTLVEEFVNKVSDLVEKRVTTSVNEVKESALEEFDSLADLLLEVGVSRQDQLNELKKNTEDNQKIFDQIAEKVEELKDQKEDEEESEEESEDKEEPKSIEDLIEESEQKVSTIVVGTAEETTDIIQTIVDDYTDQIVGNINKNTSVDNKNSEEFITALTDKEKKDEKRAKTTNQKIDKTQKTIKDRTNKFKKWFWWIVIGVLLVRFRQQIKYVTETLVQRILNSDFGKKIVEYIKTNHQGLYEFLAKLPDAWDKAWDLLNNISDIVEKILEFNAGKREASVRAKYAFSNSTPYSVPAFTEGPYLSKSDVKTLKDPTKSVTPWSDVQLYSISNLQRAQRNKDIQYKDPQTGIVFKHISADDFARIRSGATYYLPPNALPTTKNTWEKEAKSGVATLEELQPTFEQAAREKLEEEKKAKQEYQEQQDEWLNATIQRRNAERDSVMAARAQSVIPSQSSETVRPPLIEASQPYNITGAMSGIPFMGIPQQQEQSQPTVIQNQTTTVINKTFVGNQNPYVM